MEEEFKKETSTVAIYKFLPRFVKSKRNGDLFLLRTEHLHDTN